MSYNITSWRVKKLDNLIMPFPRFSPDYERRGFVVRQLYDATNGITFEEVESTITGTWTNTPDGPRVTVKTIDICGEGSGTFYFEVLVPLLRQSTGHLEAIAIWEGGDSITRLEAHAGVVTESEVEL